MKTKKNKKVKNNKTRKQFLYNPNNPKKSFKRYDYKKAETNPGDNKYTKLIKNLEENKYTS